MARVAYFTDVEGRWEKLADFCEASPLVRLDGDRITVAPGAVLVFGGDAIDRGPAGRRITRALRSAKLAQPAQVVLLAGNRDINKLRLVRELGGHPPPGLPEALRDGSRADLLRFLFSQTMGAREAFEHRRVELREEKRRADDESVVDSFLEDLAPEGELTRYLGATCLAHREDETLFVHGGVTRENLRRVPGAASPSRDVDAWIRALNAFHARSIDAFAERRLDADGTPAWSELVAYQAPLRGTRRNQGSVVYGRPTNDRGDPVLPPEDVIAELASNGVRRVVLGHTPSGDCPAILRDAAGFELVLADNSYGRIEPGSCVSIDEDGLAVIGATLLDDGAREPVSFRVTRDAETPLGLRDASSGRLVKAGLARGDFLAFRALRGYEVEQRPVTLEELGRARLEPPR